MIGENNILTDDTSSLMNVNGSNPYLTGGGASAAAPAQAPIINNDLPNTPVVQDDTPISEIINYEIAITSNLENEIGDKIKLKYEIREGETILEKDDFLLSDGNTDNKTISKSSLSNSVLNLFLDTKKILSINLIDSVDFILSNSFIIFENSTSFLIEYPFFNLKLVNSISPFINT